jgi:Uma2 family endonuclease
LLCSPERYNELMPGSEDMKRPPSPKSFGAAGPPSPAAAADQADPGLKLTYDDFLLFPDDGKRHELIDGEHYVTQSPNIRHQRISRHLIFLLELWLNEHPVGEVFYAPLDVLFSSFDVVEPDLLYVSIERAAALLAGQHVTGAPDLVVEIGSPGTRQRDETIKRRLYERSDVVEYWVVDPDIDVIRVYRRAGDRFARVEELSSEAGDVLTTALLPGLEIPLSRVFRE